MVVKLYLFAKFLYFYSVKKHLGLRFLHGPRGRVPHLSENVQIRTISGSRSIYRQKAYTMLLPTDPADLLS